MLHAVSKPKLIDKMIDAGLAEKFEVDPIILLLSQFLNRFRHQCWRSATTRSLTQGGKKVERPIDVMDQMLSAKDSTFKIATWSVPKSKS